MNTTQTPGQSMAGKRVVITGPTSGIGQEIAMQLAQLGAELVLACRDVDRGARTAAAITDRTGATSCAVMHVDTSSAQSIREFSRAYRERYSGLDVLINNAGTNRSRRHLSVDGIELVFATNVLGYFVLTQELLEPLRANAPARIVNVASSFASDLDLSDLQFERRAYDARKVYAQSKACDRMLTWAFARRLEGSGVTANAMTPGLVPQTGLYREASLVARAVMGAVGVFVARTLPQAADTAVWLASSPDVAGVNGRFFDQRKEIPCEFRGIEGEEQLWSICEELTQS